jgi:hypothetical protein
MSTTRTARTPGIIGAVGGIAIIALAALQLADRLGDTADAVLSTVGFVCLAAVPLALLRMGSTPTRVGRFGLVLWFIGLVAIPLAGVADRVFDLSQDSNALYPIGGLGQLVGGLIAGVSIARAGTLGGWVRWAPLAWAVTYAVIMPFGFTDSAGFAVVFAAFGLVATVASIGVAGAASRQPASGPVAAPAR